MRFVFAILLFNICSSILVAQHPTIKFEHYNDGDGLSHNAVRHIVQDKHGLLWIGTFGGINRFDGYQFKSYLSSSSGLETLRNDDITALLYDEDEDIMWIGTRMGLSMLNMRTYRFKTFLPNSNNTAGIPDKEIRAVFKDRFNRIWIGTKTQGFGIFDPKNEKFKKINITGFEYVKVITEDSHGNIWLGTLNEGLARITLDKKGNVKNVEKFQLKNDLTKNINPYVNFIYEDRKKDIFAGTRKGIFKLNKESNLFELIAPPNEVEESNILHFNCIEQSSEGEYYIGTLQGLITCKEIEDISKGDFKLYYSNLSDNTSLTDNLVTALFFDNSGVLWVGTENGLEKHDPYENQFELFKGISSLIGFKKSRISGFTKTYDNKLIASTHHNGLFLINGEECSHLYKDEIDIASIYSSDGKKIYCGLWNGNLLIYDYEKQKSKIIDIGINGVPLMSFCSINKKEMLIGSFGKGAILFNTQNQTASPYLANRLSKAEISEIITNTHGQIWMATERGVVNYDPVGDKLKTYRSSKNDSVGLSNNSVSDIYMDRKGIIWTSTRRGLNYYDPLSDDFMPLLSPQILRDQWITDIAMDSLGFMWLNINNNRIAKFKQNKNKLHIYQINSGNRLDVFSRSGFYYYNDQNIFLGGKEGIIHFSPSDLKDNKNSFPPFISQFKVNNNEVKVGEKINGQVILSEDINELKTVTLNHSNRDFSITFSAPSYVKEQYNKFRYKLEGFDKKWSTVDVFQRNVQYTNLLFGDYIFKVQARNSHGYWSNLTTYNITILSPIWLRPYALFTYIIFTILIVLVSKRLMKRQLILKHELILEKVKREKDEKLNQDKLRFFTNISHELRTPLTLIWGSVKLLTEQENQDQIATHHQLIYKNTQRLLALVNQILDFRKVQNGNIKLKVTEVDFSVYLQNTFNSFKPLAKEKKIEFSLNCSEEINAWFDTDKCDKILYNLLSNAFKFTPDKGKIEINVNVKQNAPRTISVCVKDSGIGISEKDQKKIFKRFFQAKSGLANNTGTGIGLSLVEHLIALHKGQIKVDSSAGKGSAFTFSIPIDKSAYTEEEIFDISPTSIVADEPQADQNLLLDPTAELKEKLLIVEDNTELRMFLKNYLSRTFDIYEATNGKEGLEQCKNTKPLICIVDVMMPVMDGLEFCSALKNDVSISHIPVVLLTALAEDENKIKGYKAGADGYLAKPFQPEVLSAKIESIINNRKKLKEKFSNESGTEVSYVSHSPADATFMSKLKDFIEANIDKPNFTVKDICEEMGMSSSKLYRKLKEITDLSPNEFIRTMRLKKSTELLRSKQYNVSEVAIMVGFNDPLYFSRCFKKQFGLSPSKY